MVELLKTVCGYLSPNIDEDAQGRSSKDDARILK
jgi:hypothetical protein